MTVQDPGHEGIRPWLRTGRLSGMASLVGSESICAVVDLVTVRVSALFCFGELGDLQQLLYHPNSREHKPGAPWAGKDLPEGRWSIRPVLRTGDHLSVPDFPLGLPQESVLDRDGAACSVNGIPMTGGERCDYVVAVDDRTLRLTVTTDSATTAGLQLSLFPIYTHVTVDGAGPVALGTGDLTLNAGATMRLHDSLGRGPDLLLAVASGRLECRAYRESRTGFLLSEGDPEEVSLPGLTVEVIGASSSLIVSLRLDRNPRASASPRAAPIVADETTAARTMGESLLAIRERCGAVMPDLRGLIPSAVNFTDLSPHEFADTDYVVSTYIPRAMMSLCAATRATQDPRYVDAAREIMLDYLARCERVGDGDAIYVVGGLLRDGTIKDAVYSDQGELVGCFYHRPSNFAVVIRALLAIRSVLVTQGRLSEAAELLGLAVSVLGGLEHTFGLNWRYVNNPHLTLARLVIAMEESGHPRAAWARDYVQTDLASRRYGLFTDREVDVCQAGAEESCPNTEQDFASVGSEALAVWLLTGEEKAAAAAVDIVRMMTLSQRFFADAPELHGSSIVESLEHYDGGYRHAAYHGGMWDLVRMEILLATGDYCDDEFSRVAARLLYDSRMAWSYRADGTVRGGHQRVPGVNYANDEWSEIHNYGVFGLYLDAAVPLSG